MTGKSTVSELVCQRDVCEAIGNIDRVCQWLEGLTAQIECNTLSGFFETETWSSSEIYYWIYM